MDIHIRYFASIREAVGRSSETVQTQARTVGELRDMLLARGEEHWQALSRGRAVRTALDQVMVEDSAPLHDGAEVAFFPPVTGG